MTNNEKSTGEQPPQAAILFAPQANFSLPIPAKIDSAVVGIVPGPGGRFTRAQRREIDRRHPFAYIWIEADPLPPEPVPLPTAFDDATLAWVLKQATLIVCWAGQRPQDGEAFTKRLARHAKKGGRIVLLLTPEKNLDQRVEVVMAQASATAEVVIEHGTPDPGFHIMEYIEVDAEAAPAPPLRPNRRSVVA